jgi:hypothetical protein
MRIITTDGQYVWGGARAAHEMLSGRHPFSGATHYDTLRAMVASEPRVEPRLSRSVHFSLDGQKTRTRTAK